MSPATRFILDCYHVGAEGLHLFGLVEEIGVGEYGFRVLFAREPSEESDFGIFGVDSVADGAVGYTAVLFDIFDS